MVLGVAVTNGLGVENAVNWGTITILCTIPSICSILAMFFMPESPLYLVSKSKENEALKALVWLRGTTNVHLELEDLKKSSREQAENANFSYTKLFTEAVYFKPFIIVIALMFTQQFSGVNAVFFNLKAIFLKAGSQIDAGLSAFIITLVQVCMFIKDKVHFKIKLYSETKPKLAFCHMDV